MWRGFLLTVLISVSLFSSGCDDMFSYSAYGVRVPEGKHNTTQLNLTKLKSIDTSTSFAFAVLSDPHYRYDDLVDAVNDINANPEIEFVVVTGDITDQGLLQEFLSFHDVMQKLDKPYFTVIGNHDYLSNGETVYSQLFGAYNYTFLFNGTAFVMWDNVVWESNKEPDFAWLESQTALDGANRTIVFSHIPPFGDQFTEAYAQRYRDAINSNATLSVHGHVHAHYEGDYYNDGMRYLVLPWIKQRQYCEITVGNESGVQTQMISY